MNVIPCCFLECVFFFTFIYDNEIAVIPKLEKIFHISRKPFNDTNEILLPVMSDNLAEAPERSLLSPTITDLGFINLFLQFDILCSQP